MTRAEEKAREAFPFSEGKVQSKFGVISFDQHYDEREGFIRGYEQAEKDTIERACDVLMNYVFEEVTPEMRDHFRKRLEEE